MLYEPFDLRKNDKYPEGSNLRYILHQPHERIECNIKKHFMAQDEGIDIDILSQIFTDTYNAPEVYTSYIPDIYISPKAKGLPRYFGFFFNKYYLFNFINDTAKEKFEKLGIFKVNGELIDLDLDNIQPVFIPGKSVWLFTFSNIDHLYRECLPSLLTLKESGEDFSKLTFITPFINSEIIALLEVLGVARNNIIQVEDRWLKCEELIIPCFGSFGHLHTPTTYYLKFANYLCEVLQNHSLKNIGSYKRLYISRKNANMRRLLNEDVIVSDLEQRGFKIIDPGDYSKIEQIIMFRNAEVVVGMHGMGLANLCFSKHTKLLLEIMSINLNKVSYFRTAQLQQSRYAAYYVSTLGQEYALPSDKFGDIIINKTKFLSFLDQNLNLL